MLNMQRHGDVFEAIDLTLSSSPEPEQKPSQFRRPQVQHYLKKELQPYNVTSVKKEIGLPRPAGQINFPQQQQQQQQQQQTRLINPGHLREILNTTDSRVLRKVILHLCQTSPALSGAVVRGLTPYSRFARDIVNRQRTTTKATIKSEGDGDDSAYERTKRRLATASGSLKTSHSFIAPIGTQQGRRASQHVPSRHTTPKVKSEPRRNPALSGTDQDSTHLPRTHLFSAPKVKTEPRHNLDSPGTIPHHTPRYPPSIQRVVPSASATRYTPQTPNIPASHRKNLPWASSLASSSHMKRESTQSQQCMQCRELFRPDEDDVCMYHPGEKVMLYDQAVYDCCDANSPEPGCQFGLHVACPDESDDDADSYKWRSVSPDSFDGDRKRARRM